MRSFKINNQVWRVVSVEQSSPLLVDRTGTKTVAITDPVRKVIYVSTAIQGKFREEVLRHELGHCIMVSFGLLDKIDSFSYNDRQVEAEEFIAQFISLYGQMVDKIIVAIND